MGDDREGGRGKRQRAQELTRNVPQAAANASECRGGGETNGRECNVGEEHRQDGLVSNHNDPAAGPEAENGVQKVKVCLCLHARARVCLCARARVGVPACSVCMMHDDAASRAWIPNIDVVCVEETNVDCCQQT